MSLGRIGRGKIVRLFQETLRYKKEYTSVMIVPTGVAMLYWPVPNVLYVVGYGLDRFVEGLWALQLVHQNRVGLVLDAAIEGELRLCHLLVADATRASLGLPVLEYIVTDTPLLVEKWVDPKSGQSTGRIKHPVCISFLLILFNPQGIDDLAGVEAVISHLVVKEFQIPCAHAPALSPFPLSLSLCPKSAAEEVSNIF
ncbi:putative lipoprotein [Vitis vinifera]|uniref:Putative lipoprotein n=1 Tax=Vitis vinifera TaxID=29760 RepID=A0A438JU59_VITVI|nr:putative lipoprotein [Vitis vinifera]